MQLKNRNYILALAFTWIGSGALILLFYAFLIHPRSITLLSLKNELSKKSRDLEVALECANEKNKTLIQQNRIEWQDKLNDFVANTGGSMSAIFEITQIAKQLDISEFTYKQNMWQDGTEEENKNVIQQGKTSVAFSSSFMQFANFINMLERHKPVIFVESFSFERGDSGQLRHRAQMMLTYFVGKK